MTTHTHTHTHTHLISPYRYDDLSDYLQDMMWLLWRELDNRYSSILKSKDNLCGQGMSQHEKAELDSLPRRPHYCYHAGVPAKKRDQFKRTTYIAVPENFLQVHMFHPFTRPKYLRRMGLDAAGNRLVTVTSAAGVSGGAALPVVPQMASMSAGVHAAAPPMSARSGSHSAGNFSARSGTSAAGMGIANTTPTLRADYGASGGFTSGNVGLPKDFDQSYANNTAAGYSNASHHLNSASINAGQTPSLVPTSLPQAASQTTLQRTPLPSSGLGQGLPSAENPNANTALFVQIQQNLTLQHQALAAAGGDAKPLLSGPSGVLLQVFNAEFSLEWKRIRFVGSAPASGREREPRPPQMTTIELLNPSEISLNALGAQPGGAGPASGSTMRFGIDQLERVDRGKRVLDISEEIEDALVNRGLVCKDSAIPDTARTGTSGGFTPREIEDTAESRLASFIFGSEGSLILIFPDKPTLELCCRAFKAFGLNVW